MYPVFESIAVLDGKYLNLNYHTARMQRTAKALWQQSIPGCFLEQVLPPFDGNGLFKCRFLYNQESYRFTFEAYQFKHIQQLLVREAAHVDYAHKYVNRNEITQYTQDLEPNTDVLFTRNGFLTDTSYANIALKQGDVWFTPEVPLLAGTRRAAYVEQKKMITRAIHRDSLPEYEFISWFNALIPLGEACLPISAIRCW